MNNDELLKAELAKAVAECERLREENAQLRFRIGEDIEGVHQDVERLSPNEDVKAHPADVSVDSPPEIKVSFFKDLFRCRDDVYAVRWEGRNGKTGYSRAGNKEWDKAPSSGRGPKKSFRITKLFSLTEECAFLKMCHETGVPASLLMTACFQARTRCPKAVNVRHGETDYDGSSAPWILPPSGQITEKFITEPLPPNVSIKLGNLIYVEKKDLPDVFLDRLIRLAAFQNPEFYRAQVMRLSTFDKPRVIACAEDLLRYIALPRGLLKEVLDLFESHRIAVKVTDHRFGGVSVEVEFNGDARANQIAAVKALAAYDEGILCAPTAFGKTAVVARLIALRRVNTLVLVHRRQLMDQWRERLALFLGLNVKDIGQMGGGKNTQTGRLDVAVIQSMIRKGEVKDIVAEYGQVIVDECHHVSAFSFERVLKKVKAKYVVGLTATPVRKDGHHPIILMQCGPIRFNVSSKKQASASALQYEVTPRLTEFTVPPEWNDIGIQDIYTALVHDDQRSDLIVSDVVGAIEDGRFPLLLTERTDHLEILFERLARRVPNIFVMKGGMGKKQRDATTREISAVPDGQPRVILATGRYIGEGFDDARLDTLFLAMPISWRGTLQQYVGRLHRLHANKRIVRVYDYVDTSVPVLNRMYEKRIKAYEAVGYTVAWPSAQPEAQADLRFATIERIAVEAAIAFEEARGCTVQSVESDTRGFDLISRRVLSKTEGERVTTRFIEVKGRAEIGEIALTANEYKTALSLGDDYWLYVVFNCGSQPKVTTIQNPARFDGNRSQRLIATG